MLHTLDARESELDDNGLEALLSSSCNAIANLNRLSLHNNLLENLPSQSLSTMTNLTYLSLHFNRIEHLPDEIGNLNMLRRLSLHQNRLRSLPLSMSNLTNLVAVSLFRNSLTTLNGQQITGCWTKCERFAFHQNDSLPTDETYIPIDAMSSLKELWLPIQTDVSHAKHVYRHIQNVWVDGVGQLFSQSAEETQHM